MSSNKGMQIQEVIATLEKRIAGHYQVHKTTERNIIKLLREYRDLLKSLGDFE